MVAWYSEKDKSRLYDGTYSDEQINQATQLQRSICGLSDMFAQIIVNHREFDKDYASRNIYFDSEVVSLRSENARLKLENENLKLRVRDLEEKAER
jgi:cell division protein FtsB